MIVLEDNARLRSKWINPDLRHIDEADEDGLTEEYGSEIGGF